MHNKRSVTTSSIQESKINFHQRLSEKRQTALTQKVFLTLFIWTVCSINMSVFNSQVSVGRRSTVVVSQTSFSNSLINNLRLN